MKPRERVLRVLEGREPDKIPLILDGWIQSGLHFKLVKELRCTSKLNLVGWLLLDKLTAMLPKPARELLIYGYAWTYDSHFLATRLGSDGVIFWHVPMSPYYSFDIRKGSYTDYFGDKHYIKNFVDWREEGTRPVKSEADLDRYRWPDFDSVLTDFLGKFVISRFPDHASFGMFPYGGPFESAQAVRGMTELLMDFYRNPRFARKILDGCTRVGIESIRKLAEIGADGVIISDDYGTQTGLMISPMLLEREIIPRLKKLVNECKRRGLFAILHSDGNIARALDSLAECGFDAIHPLQPGAMNEFEAIEKYRGKFVPYTGMEVQHLLPRSNPAAIKEYIKRLIELASPSLILGPTNAVPNETPVENLLAALEAREIYGKIR